jgi:polyferredoxin
MARKSRNIKSDATPSAGTLKHELEMPVLRPRQTGGCGKIRPSLRGRWRALSLILLHVAVVVHVVQWWITGTTLTPVEPSEAMQTLGDGLINAGFVLFAVAILATLIFGRFFCGWGCHIVALQDLCTWLLKRVGIRPRPFRSRVLVWVPLAAALWMFVAPTLTRLWIAVERPEFRAHFMTEDFWERFPGPFVALLTFFVCGFLIVYLLGNKGFCTYGCPYGGIFGLADQVAPGKIRVTDACEGCAHCTATCGSNVRVHEEVRPHGMVVDPGCMKCMD